MVPSLFEYRVYLWQLLSGIRSRYEAIYANFGSRVTSENLNHGKSPKILDLGNARLGHPFSLLMCLGHCVYGVEHFSRRWSYSLKFDDTVTKNYVWDHLWSFETLP
jgi:hypothetical protein